MRQNDLRCAQSRVGAEPINAVQIGGSACGYQRTFAMSASPQIRGRLDLPPWGLNIYAP